LTAVGVIPGTAVYMSPEQARSEEIDFRSDLFSFGVVMYEMSTGKKPFTGKNSLMTLDAVLHDKPVPPGELNPKVPVELEGIIGKAMEKDRKQRYQSATQMKADLQQLKRETESGQVKSGLHHREAAGCEQYVWANRKPVAVLVVAGNFGAAGDGVGGGGSVLAETPVGGQRWSRRMRSRCCRCRT
jgi:serine/threonine protein kinase